jgi:TRAP-type C4-dicarboxylate transport system permease small subunit
MSSVESAAAPGGKSTLDRLAKVAAAIAGLVLASVVILTVTDVTLRLVARPVYGSQEITELSMVAIIMLAIPLCATSGSDIRVDLFDEMLGKRGKWMTDLLAAIVTIVVLGFLVWNTVFKIVATYTYDDVSNLLLVPLWPFYLLIALSMGLYAVVALVNCVALLNRRPVADE